MRKKNQTKVTINRIFYNLLKPFLSLWFKYTFRLGVNIPEEVKRLKPPYLLMPNHQGFWDPFMAGLYIKYPIFYITSDAVFRYPLLEFFMKLLGAIPKQKARSDMEAVKNIMKIRDAGGIIGIFPEGRRTWDGTTLPLIFSTSKLVKLLKVPVVTALFKGGYLSHPRWGVNFQRGRINIDYSLLLSKEKIKELSVEQIHAKLSKALEFDEIENQIKERVPFKGKNPAEYLEQTLFTCPSCSSMGTLVSVNDIFKCTNCSYSVRFNKYRMLDPVSGERIFDNIRDWNAWQLEELKKHIAENRGKDEILLKDSNLIIQSGYRMARMKTLLGNGNIELTWSTLTVKDQKGAIFVEFPVKNISGINVQNKEKLDFYVDGVLYNIFDRRRRFSAFKWLNGIEIISEKSSD